MKTRYITSLLTAIIFLSTLMSVALPAHAAIDNRVLFVSAAHSNKAKITLIKEQLGDASGLVVEQKAESTIKIESATALFSNYDLVVFDGVSKRESKSTYEKYIPIVEQLKRRGDSKFLAINWLEQDLLRVGVSEGHAKTLHDYYGNGGIENISRMIDFLRFRILEVDLSKAVEPAIIYPQMGIYHPESETLTFSSLDDYLQWKKYDADSISSDISGNVSKNVVGVLLQRSLIESAQTQVVDDAISRIESTGALAVPFFFELSPMSSDYTPLIRRNEKTFVDVIVNFRNIHWATKRKTEFEKIGVPVLQGLTYFDGDQAAWEADSQGISAGMTPFVLVLPEAAGVVDPMIVAAVDEESGRALPIDYQLEHFINKAINVAELKHKSNVDKKMTVMVWGSIDVGASFLNIPESLRSISGRMNAEGYRVDAVDSDYYTDKIKPILEPFYREFELDKLLADDLAELMPVSDYLSWFNQLPDRVTAPINEYWGTADKGFMVVEREGKSYFVIPRIRNGNLLVMRQPPRSDDKNEDQRIYHKGTVPMNHFYLAAYFYARTYWESDALIHLGTHGSQEYLSGKERGLSRYDQGNLAVWDTPVLYPFIVDDVGEAMQTKRRGSATVLAHMTPPFAAAGLQGEVADLHELMHQYKSLDDGGVKKKTADQIVNDCIENSICADFGWSEVQAAADFNGFLDALHDYMEDLSSQNQPLGLHSFGELPEVDLLTSTLLQMLDRSFPSRISQFERDYFDVQGHHSSLGHDHSNSSDEYAHHADGGGDFHGAISQVAGDELDKLVGFKTLRTFVIERTASAEEMGEAGVDEAGIVELQKAQQRYVQMRGMKELDHLMMGLSGQYIAVKNGGDPIRSPDAVPTGFNLYGFDPSRVPTKAAFKQGSELVDEVIANYYQKHGRYPDKLAFSLWSIETMRHYGVLESQALYAMGVKPIWSDDGRVVGTEIIPASELKRPRVDVVLSATGLYRDAFPNVMQRLAKAIEEVATLKEENNSIWDNSQRVAEQLKQQGVEEAEAEYLSTVRIFSNASGEYGSGVNDAVVASDTWEQDSKISDLYLSKMGFFYGSDNSRWGKKVGSITDAEGNVRDIDLYAQQLSGTDVALFSRSSNVYGMITSDDPFEYFGSLALAVRNIDGESPEMMISNLRDANNAKTETAATFMAKELRSRNFHKRWVEEMMKEGYSGATTMSSNLTNFWGWNVVDPNIVREDQWQEFFEVYVDDKLEVGINEWFEEVNAQSQANMLERMLEANRKDYWQADEETLKKIVERFAELTNRHDLFVDNEKLREYFDTAAAGFGLDLSLPEIDPTASMSANEQQQAKDVVAQENPPSEQIEGQKLEKVEAAETDQEWDSMLLGSLVFCLFSVIGGMLLQIRPQRSSAV